MYDVNSKKDDAQEWCSQEWCTRMMYKNDVQEWCTRMMQKDDVHNWLENVMQWCNGLTQSTVRQPCNCLSDLMS